MTIETISDLDAAMCQHEAARETWKSTSERLYHWRDRCTRLTGAAVEVFDLAGMAIFQEEYYQLQRETDRAWEAWLEQSQIEF